MTNKEFELMLTHTCLVLFAIIGFLFVCRVVKIIVTKEVETKEDFVCLAFLLSFMFVCYYVKEKFKKTKI